ncbi:hypothetical protein C900_03632 [Fulvivirga imtechensis AK7]|uniref:DUF1835 domain-containing protein n=1 Tax=Fulvivirga imtechensis AK7 TaxID=1237149 RepID=L8JNW3_9BACT|nr:DUF1835 domain-containing protein [Fulvivirga imtechensis]ELR70651.1 hypothetical protein C900_03632 [Fulvivirga imtechensis AK7]
MREQYHILNGDALKEQFPKSIPGKIVVARECLVDGDVEGRSLEELLATRAYFISATYHGYSEEDYYEETAHEFYKIRLIPANSVVNLWFEDDLFCQVNLWFILHLLYGQHKQYHIWLVRPQVGHEYGFGSMSSANLVEAFESRISIEPIDFDLLRRLWRHYQLNETGEMLHITGKLKIKFPFLQPAVQAHIDRIPANNNPGKPQQTLIDIIDELNTDEFGPVFREFCKRESIYGFGDLQVKRMFDEVKKGQ